MKPGLLRFAFMLPGLLLTAVLGAQDAARAAQGSTLYISKIVTAPAGDISLGTLVRASVPLSPEAKEAMSRSVTRLADTLQYVPASLYMDQLATAFGPDAIVVGSRTVLIPAGTTAASEPYLVDRLSDFLIAQNLLGDSKADINFSQTSLKGAPPQDGTPTFQVMKSARGVEVSFLLTGSDGSAVSGRVSLATADAGTDFAAGIRSNAVVRIVFRKGPITVEMPGKALASASLGENVNVRIAESQKTFTGRVIEGKVVQVDLP